MDTLTGAAAGTDAGPGQSERLMNLPSRLLSQIANYTDRLVNEALAAVDAHKWHYAVLVTVRDVGSCSQAALSRRTGIYRSDMVALITELAGRGLVRRAPDPADQRRNLITLTPDGRRHLRKLDKVVDRLQKDILAPLTEPEREQLTELLKRLLDHLAKGSPPIHVESTTTGVGAEKVTHGR